jgi:hypothetical protein
VKYLWSWWRKRSFTRGLKRDVSPTFHENF